MWAHGKCSVDIRSYSCYNDMHCLSKIGTSLLKAFSTYTDLPSALHILQACSCPRVRTCWGRCLECSPSSSPHDWLLLIFQVSASMSSPRGFPCRVIRVDFSWFSPQWHSVCLALITSCCRLRRLFIFVTMVCLFIKM